MNSLRAILFLAALAGLVAGVAMSLMQFATTVPMIFEAETYEVAEAPETDAAASADAADPAHDADHDHAEEWEPSDGFVRSGLTVVANVVTAIGFALLLVAASESFGGLRTWRQGFAWGFAGFASFVLAPGLGLPPNMPGMPAADIDPRQVWWVATALLTAGGLGLVAFGRSLAFGAVGALLIVLPHVIGAPQPVDPSTAVPEALHHRFIVAVMVTTFVFWAILGVAVSLLRPRFAADLDAPRRQIA